MLITYNMLPSTAVDRCTDVYCDGEVRIRVAIVAGEGLLRGALRTVLSRENDLEVTAEFDPDIEAAAFAGEPKPHVVVIDMDLPDRQWQGIARRISRQVPDCATVVLTGEPTPRSLHQALQAQVRGFASKRLPPTELVDLIRRVARGDRVIDLTTAVAALTAARNPLTEREREILRLASEGLTSRTIGRRLFLTDGTVRNHLSSALRKTGARNRQEAIRRAQDAGWL
jgi:two-component system response regulator DesR